MIEILNIVGRRHTTNFPQSCTKLLWENFVFPFYFNAIYCMGTILKRTLYHTKKRQITLSYFAIFVYSIVQRYLLNTSKGSAKI